ncbi:SRPBCC family protein [Actinomadura graeca]|uniref:SRPBCC family protein n=1 Tax=Actinomadura graeca TaxID=2750812 RepID=A0ABX8R1U4_9ACTN|nr:hypothetical protein [Actinomadura graeca]QXJ22973.1 SRPBCC family protein [Actinomadura graeca]
MTGLPSPAVRRRMTGRVETGLPPDEAFALFTPRGEERWVPGWHPLFPAATGDDTEPGTVFETVRDGVTTTWVVVARERGRHISYARITPGHRAGTVTVRLAGDGSAEVTYDLTGAADDIDAFAAGYADFLGAWRDAIQSARTTFSPPSA